jgi:hypothetical protein
MNFNCIYAWAVFALYIPFVLMGMILAHYLLIQFYWSNEKRRGKRRFHFYSSAALGMGLLSVEVFFRPSSAYVLAEKQVEEADDDAEGNPASPETRLKHFHRQLRRIRQGEPVDQLVLRI